MVPTWANPADAPSRNKPIESWYASLPKLPPTQTAVFTSAHALSMLALLREPPSAHTAGKHLCKLESSGAFSCSNLEPAFVNKMNPRKTTYGGERMCGNCLVIASRTTGRTKKQTKRLDWSHPSCWHCHDAIFITPGWFTSPPGLALPTVSQPDNWRDELLSRAGDIEDIPDQNSHFLCEDKTSWCRACI